MSRATVRRAIVDRLTDSHLTGLGTVFRGQPTAFDDDDFLANAPQGQAWGVVLAVHIGPTNEYRIGYGGAHGGQKRVDYTVDLRIALRCTDTAHDPGLAAEDAYDAFLDDLKAWIRADREAMAPGVVWQWAEGGMTDDTDPPVQLQNSVQVWGRLTVQVTEMIDA